MSWSKMKKDELVKACRDMEEKLKELEKELNEVKDRNRQLEDYAKRLKAQFENYKRESAEEKQRIMKNATEYIISKIIPVLDDFDRALRSVEDKTPFVEGVEKIYRKLVRILESEGLSIIDPEGGQFDPFEHEAFEKVETDEHEEFSVIEVVEKGYKLHSKVLKPAKVRVAIRPKG